MTEDKTTINKLEQGRAEFAYLCAEKNSKSSKAEEYKSYVKKIPILIKTNGLGATLAFMLSKGGTYLEIGENIKDWLKKDNKNLIKSSDINSFKDLVEEVVKLDSSEYRVLTNEVLAFSSWFKRFADGLCEKSKGNKDEGQN